MIYWIKITVEYLQIGKYQRNWHHLKLLAYLIFCSQANIYLLSFLKKNRFSNKIHKFTMLGLKIDFNLSTFIAHTLFIIHFSKLHIVSLLVFLATLTVAWKVENIFFFLNDCLKLNQSNKKLQISWQISWGKNCVNTEKPWMKISLNLISILSAK